MFKEIDLNKSIHLMNVIATYKFRISCKKDRKKTQRKITDIIRSHHICWTHHEYDRAIGNSIAHGSCPVKCKIYVGTHGQLLCVIKDKGNGFDYKDVIEKFRQHKMYYHHKGYGFRCYARNEHLQVDWKNQGRTIILFYN